MKQLSDPRPVFKGQMPVEIVHLSASQLMQEIALAQKCDYYPSALEQAPEEQC